MRIILIILIVMNNINHTNSIDGTSNTHIILIVPLVLVILIYIYLILLTWKVLIIVVILILLIWYLAHFAVRALIQFSTPLVVNRHDITFKSSGVSCLGIRFGKFEALCIGLLSQHGFAAHDRKFQQCVCSVYDLVYGKTSWTRVFQQQCCTLTSA